MCAECPSFTWALFISHEKRFPLRIAILGISADNQIKLQNKPIPFPFVIWNICLFGQEGHDSSLSLSYETERQNNIIPLRKPPRRLALILPH